MKQTVRLEALPEPPNLLEAGERLFPGYRAGHITGRRTNCLLGRNNFALLRQKSLPVSSPNLPVIGLCVRQVGAGHLF